MKVWVQIGKKWTDDEVKNCVENGYINGKPNTKKLTVQIVDALQFLLQQALQKFRKNRQINTL